MVVCLLIQFFDRCAGNVTKQIFIDVHQLNKWMSCQYRILVFGQRFVGSPLGKHCEFLERNAERKVVSTPKRLFWREFNFFSAPIVIRQKDRGAKGQIVAHAPMNSVRRVRCHWDPFSFQLGDRHLFCNIFWRGIKENDKFTSIFISVDTRGVCWPLGWEYFNDQSANKKSPITWKFEIWFTEDQDVQRR